MLVRLGAARYGLVPSGRFVVLGRRWAGLSRLVEESSQANAESIEQPFREPTPCSMEVERVRMSRAIL
jgi:hypothetical protein